MNTCPTCQRGVGDCARCGGPIVELQWASAQTNRGHEHYHMRCLTPAELREYQQAMAETAEPR